MYNINEKIPIRYEFFRKELGVSGLTVTGTLQRLSDNLFFDGTNWVATSTPLAFVESTLGIYIYEFDTNGLEEDSYIMKATTIYENNNYPREERFKTFNFNDIKTIKDKTDNIGLTVWEYNITESCQT